jgi:exportin-7
MFYTSLGRLLMVDLGEDEERFHTFMLPLTGKKIANVIYCNEYIFFYTISGALESLGQLMGAADTPLFAAEEAKKALIGLARDLRGLAFAFNTKSSYMMLFDWMYVCMICNVSLYLAYISNIKKSIFILYLTLSSTN